MLSCENIMSVEDEPPTRPIDAAAAPPIRFIQIILHHLNDLFNAPAVWPSSRPIEADTDMPPARHIDASDAALEKVG